MTSYVELHCHSCYSLLDGASSPAALVARAAELRMPALALTDHDALYGAIPFARACTAAGIHPIFGAELTVEGGDHLTLLVENKRGWGNLCTLLSMAQARAPKGAAHLPLDALAEHSAGLLVLSGCARGAVMGALQRDDPAAARAALQQLVAYFGAGQVWVELQHHLHPFSRRLVARGLALAAELDLPCVATNNVHYVRPAQHRLHDLLHAIRHGKTLDQLRAQLRANTEYFLKGAREMQVLFTAAPAALRATLEIANRCTFALPDGIQPLPVVSLPPGLDPDGYLRQLCERALHRCYGTPTEPQRAQLAHELAIIRQVGLANYFLLVWDVVHWARARGIRCQGRGSACNALVAFLLGISPIDPLAHGLVFERFLSAERKGVPDIDIDLQADRREEVIRYLYQRYGPEHVAMACTLVTFGARSALRDTGKALGIPAELIAPIARLLEGRGDAALAESPELAALATRGQTWAQLQELARALEGLPRHLGLHNGGMILSRAPLATRIPVEPAAMVGRTVVQWDKDALEEAGWIKLDLLGLRMLSVLSEASGYVAAESGQPCDLDALPRDDPGVYQMLCAADTIGLFQVESRAQAQVLPRLQPRCFQDIILAISLIRPGPLQGQMVHPFLRRRAGEEPVCYAHPLLEAALEETLGVILFQEQVLKVARDLAAFTPGEGELLRRAVGRKHGTALSAFHARFLRGARKQGVAPAVAEEVWDQLCAFGGYAFAKSHAAAFACLVYQSAWLKRYYPAPFFCALLNQQPMGFWSPAVLLGDARRHGVTVLPVDVECSHVRSRVRAARLRLGLGQVKELGEHATSIVAARQEGPFGNLATFCRRTRVPRHLVHRLVRAGAMDCWGRPRRALLLELEGLHYREEMLPLDSPAEPFVLPPLPPLKALAWEHELMGLSAGVHLLALLRPWLQARAILDSREVARQPAGRVVAVAGIKVMHQAPPTAHGVRFLTLEDEHGLINIVVPQATYARHRLAVRQSRLLLVTGRLQQRGGASSIRAHHLEPLHPPAEAGAV